MKAFLTLFFFLALTEIAVAQDAVLAPMTIESQALANHDGTPPKDVSEVKSALADCIQQTVHDITPVGIVAAYPVILLVLRVLAELFGKLAAKGSASASSAVVVLRYLSALLGWAFGKGGFSVPKAAMAQKKPCLKTMKEEAAKNKKA